MPRAEGERRTGFVRTVDGLTDMVTVPRFGTLCSPCPVVVKADIILIVIIVHNVIGASARILTGRRAANTKVTLKIMWALWSPLSPAVCWNHLVCFSFPPHCLASVLL